MTLREKVAAALYEDSCREDNAESMNGFLSWDEFVEINGKRSKTVLRYFRRADAALAVIRAVFATPTPEMVRASVQGWLDSGLMSGAIREAARVVLGDDNSTAGGE